MKRYLLLVVTVIFLLALSTLTVYDITHNGVNALSIFALIIIAFITVTVVGALTARPPEDDLSYPVNPPQDGPGSRR